MSIAEYINAQPLSNEQLIELTKLVQTLGGSLIQIGLMDDVAPDGSPDTACSQSFEEAQTGQQIVVVKNQIAPGIHHQSTFRLNLPPSRISNFQ